MLLSALLVAALSTLVALVVEPPPRGARGEARTSGLELGAFDEFDYVNVSGARIVVDSGEGATGSRFASSSSRQPRHEGVARGVWDVDWVAGDTVCYGATFRFPAGFFGAADGIDILRWDNYVDGPTHPDQGGVTVWADRRARVVVEQASRASTYRVLAESEPLPVAQWVRVVVQQHLSKESETASTVLFVNGIANDSSEIPNSFGRPLRALRVGLVAVHGARSAAEIELHFDDAFYAKRPCGSHDW